MSKKKRNLNVDNYIEEATKNIESDRALALTLVTDLMQSMVSAHDHRDLGQTAAKYLETLQRSNEQLVKLTAMLSKKAATSEKLSNTEMEEIFDLLNTENSGG